MKKTMFTFCPAIFMLILTVILLNGCGSSSAPIPTTNIPPINDVPTTVVDTSAATHCSFTEAAININTEEISRIETENYDTCENSYLDNTPDNSGQVYRDQNVDIQSNNSLSNGYYINDMQEGEYLEYSVIVSKSGLYQLTYHARAKADLGENNTAKLQVSILKQDNEEVLKNSELQLTSTENSTWQNITQSNVYLSDGEQTIRVNVLADGAELDYLEFNYNEPLSYEPFTAVNLMKVGLNLGNTLDAPNEGDWAPKAQQQYFIDFKKAGFNNVRIPVTWAEHTALTAPYNIDEAWLSRVDQVVDWALSQNYFVILNAHHEAWLKEHFDNAINRERFTAIWQQIIDRFQHKSARLVFEILNEPHGMNTEQVNGVNDQILTMIRDKNPKRLVVFSGAGWTPLESLLEANVPQFNYIIGNFHVYDPWEFAGLCTRSWGSQEDIDKLEDIYNRAQAWSRQNNIPVTINEVGVAKYDFQHPENKCKQSERIAYYQAHVEFAKQRNIAISIWDDSGSFGLYNRANGTWPEELSVLVTP